MGGSDPGSSSFCEGHQVVKGVSTERNRSRSLERQRGGTPRSLGSEESDKKKCHDTGKKSRDAFKRSHSSSHRHSIPSKGQAYLKFLQELASKGSSTGVFSTAVISGSSSAPNLKDSPQPGDTGSAVPGIRPLETLHNALSLRQLDSFLGYVTSTNFKTPSPSPAHKGGDSPLYQRGGDASSGSEGHPPADRYPPLMIGMVSRDSSS